MILILFISKPAPAAYPGRMEEVMNAILTKPLKSSVKTIHGQVLQDGMNRITLVVTDKKGNRSVKGFTKSDYTIRYYE